MNITQTKFNLNTIPTPHKSFQVGLFIKNSIYKITRTALYYLSPKQIVRCDSFSEMCFSVFSKSRNILSRHCWKLQSLFKTIIPIKESTSYMNSLLALKKLSKENSPLLSLEEKSSLNQVLDQALNNKNYLEKFDFFISSQEAAITGLHNDFKKLLLINDKDFFDPFYSKIERLSKLEIEGEVESINENEKLNLKDVCILSETEKLKSLAESLYRNEITGMEISVLKWSKIETILKSSFFENLKKTCLESRPAGTIFLSDRNVVDISTGRQPTCTDIFRRIFMGRVAHIGIFVQPKEKGLHLSHTNQFTNNHAIAPVLFPLRLPYSYSLELNISPLIPKEVSKEDQEVLLKLFSSTFQKFAEEHHPELVPARSKRHLNMLFFGHKKVFAEPLEKVQLKTPIMCSSYVGIIFLKAIREVNIKLKKLNYEKEIPHPFGEHENVMNLDILRLVYLWKRLNIIWEPKFHPTINKVMSSLCSLNLTD